MSDDAAVADIFRSLITERGGAAALDSTQRIVAMRVAEALASSAPLNAPTLNVLLSLLPPKPDADAAPYDLARLTDAEFAELDRLSAKAADVTLPPAPVPEVLLRPRSPRQCEAEQLAWLLDALEAEEDAARKVNWKNVPPVSDEDVAHVYAAITSLIGLAPVTEQKVYGTWISLQRSGQQSVGRIAGEGEEQMPDVLDRNAVLEQRVVDRIGKRQVVQLEETSRDEGQGVSGWTSAVLVEAGAGFGEDLGGKRRAALRLRLEEMEALSLSVLKDGDDVVPAHGHVAMVFPAQALDRSAIAAAMRIDPLRRVDLAEIARADRLRCRQLALNQRGCRRLAEAGERARHLLLRRIVRRDDRRRRLNPRRKLCGLAGHHSAEVVPDRLIHRMAPIVELRHASSGLMGKDLHHPGRPGVPHDCL
jgi:hypothetical protein